MTEPTPATATRYSSVFELGDESDSFIIEPREDDESASAQLVLSGAVIEIAVRVRGRYASKQELDWIDNLVDTLADWRKAIVEPTDGPSHPAPRDGADVELRRTAAATRERFGGDGVSQR